MPRSEAQKEADKRYRAHAKTKIFSVGLTEDEIFAINDFVEKKCKPISISKARFIFRCINYFINNDEIPPE